MSTSASCFAAAVLIGCGGALLVAGEAAIPTGIRIAESTTADQSGRKTEFTRLTTIQGLKMRVDVQQQRETNTTIYDAEGQVRITLDAHKREARVKSFRDLQAAVDARQPRPTSSIHPTGRAAEVLGHACEEYDFEIRSRVVKGGDGPLLIMTGVACVAKNVAGRDQYAAFAAAAQQANLVIGLNSENPVFVAIALAQTERYRLLAGLGGVPLRGETRVRFEGGFLATLLNKTGAGTTVSRVTELSTEPVDSARFAVPDGWKRK